MPFISIKNEKINETWFLRWRAMKEKEKRVDEEEKSFLIKNSELSVEK